MWKLTHGSFTNFRPITAPMIRIDWMADGPSEASDENSQQSDSSNLSRFSPTITSIKLNCYKILQTSIDSPANNSSTSTREANTEFYIALFHQNRDAELNFNNIVCQPRVDKSNQELICQLLRRSQDADGWYWCFDVHHFSANQLDSFLGLLKHQLGLNDDMIVRLSALCLPYIRPQTPSEIAFFKNLLEIETCTGDHKIAQALLNQKFNDLLIRAQGIIEGTEHQGSQQFIFKERLRQNSDALWRLAELCRTLHDIPHRIACLEKQTKHEYNIYCTDRTYTELADLIRVFQGKSNMSPNVSSLDDEEDEESNHKQNANLLMKVAGLYLKGGAHGAPILFNAIADHAALPEKAQQAINNLSYNSEENFISDLVETFMIFAESHYELIQENKALRANNAVATRTSSLIPSTMASTTAAASTTNREETGSATTSSRELSSPAVLHAYSAAAAASDAVATVRTTNNDANQNTNKCD